MKISQESPPPFAAITLTIETFREAQILNRMAACFVREHAQGPVEIAFAQAIESWFAQNQPIGWTRSSTASCPEQAPRSDPPEIDIR